jgi:hypothetical protein
MLIPCLGVSLENNVDLFSKLFLLSLAISTILYITLKIFIAAKAVVYRDGDFGGSDINHLLIKVNPRGEVIETNRNILWKDGNEIFGVYMPCYGCYRIFQEIEGRIIYSFDGVKVTIPYKLTLTAEDRDKEFDIQEVYDLAVKHGMSFNDYLREFSQSTVDKNYNEMKKLVQFFLKKSLTEEELMSGLLASIEIPQCGFSQFNKSTVILSSPVITAEKSTSY